MLRVVITVQSQEKRVVLVPVLHSEQLRTADRVTMTVPQSLDPNAITDPALALVNWEPTRIAHSVVMIVLPLGKHAAPVLAPSLELALTVHPAGMNATRFLGSVVEKFAHAPLVNWVPIQTVNFVITIAP